MGTVALIVAVAAYCIGGVYTVREMYWCADLRYMTASDLLSVALAFLIWPFTLMVRGAR